MIKLEGVKKSYGTTNNIINAVDNVTIDITDSEFVMITGHSGSGKTTLLNIIGGMTRPDQGKVEVAGRDILTMPDSELSRFRANTIGFVFQFQSMLPTLNALDNVRLPLTFAGSKSDDGRAESLLEAVGLGDRMEAYARELSAGQQRRVGIARAMINQPSLLLCDEPTGDLDPDAEAVIMDMIAEAHKNGAAVLMTTHNHALRSYATRTLSIVSGEIKKS